jgi:hypothetical protein
VLFVGVVRGVIGRDASMLPSFSASIVAVGSFRSGGFILTLVS